MSKDSEMDELLKKIDEAKTPEDKLKLAQAFSEEFFENSAKKKKEKRLQMEEAARFGFHEICTEWARRDFWNLWEGLNLLKHRHPETRDWYGGVADLWRLAQTCIGPGGSLRVVNPEAKALTNPGLIQKYKVRPMDLLGWAQVKNIPVPNELETVLSGVKGGVSASATLSLEERKRKRLSQIRQFVDILYAQAANAGMDWAVQKLAIVATKQEFKSVFELYMRVPLVERISQDTFNDDLKSLGIKFARGVKNRSDNDLSKLFGPKLG